jgi:hypothetical protein
MEILMKSLLTPRTPLLIVCAAAIALLLYGPIVQFAHYHAFADQSVMAGLPHAADVLSNLPFLLIAIWGGWHLWPQRDHPALKAGYAGYRLFLIGLFLTAFGSSFYHLAPDNARLVWDRLPIALVCAGLLAAVRAETRPTVNGEWNAVLLGLFAIASVAWWAVTERLGTGDLRPYLLLQAMPLVLIPLWQTIYRAPRADRQAFVIALLLYAIAKVTEIQDHEILSITHVISGHTLKHLLAAMATGVLVSRLIQRVKAPAAADQHIMAAR